MDAIPSNLCILVEQLEDARQFHMCAAQASNGDRHQRHCELSDGYAAMLAEIRLWKQGASQPAREAHSDSGRDDGPIKLVQASDYVTLMHHISRMHRALVASVKPAVRIRANGDAMDGVAMEGRRCAGERMRC